jgi:SAM-dependent methyltransferase
MAVNTCDTPEVQPLEAKGSLLEYHVTHFRRGPSENAFFWSRMGVKPDFDGARVLEIGSGWGALAMEIGAAGAERVVGIDLMQSRLGFASRYLQEERPELEGIVKFYCIALKDYPDEHFTLAVTKDAFEHVMDLPEMLAEIHQRLAPGGKLYAGFGPLYPSPYGDHSCRREILKHWGPLGRLLAKLPWGHLLLERVLVGVHNRRNEKKINSLRSFGLNKLAFSDYERILRESDFDVVAFHTNRGGKVSSRILSFLARVPFLRDCCIHNVFCILEKKDAEEPCA